MKTKILIAGTGAVGGYFGGLLAQNPSLDVCFLSRGKTLSALRENGLRITGAGINIRIRINVSDNAESFRKKFDYVFVSVKSEDTESAVSGLGKVITPRTQFVTVQNGIENYGLLKKMFGKGRVICGVSKIGVEMDDKSVIHHYFLGTIVTGEENGRRTKRILGLNKILAESGIKNIIADDIIKELWIKFAWNSIFNTLTGILSVTTDKLFLSSDTEKLVLGLYSELKKIAKTQGVTFGKKEFRKIITDTKTLSGFRTSTLQDRIKGKPLETGQFLETILRISSAHRIRTPLFRILYAMHMAVQNS